MQAQDYYNKGLLAFEKKNYDYAIELFSSAIGLKKDFAEARHYLRLAAQRKAKQGPSGFLFNLINKIKGLPFLLKALFLDSKNRSAEACVEYEKALRSDPDNVYILNRLAQDLLKLNDTSSALKTFEEIIAVNSKNIPALKNMGRLYSQTGNYPSALQCFETILKITPHDPDAEKGIKNLDALGTIRKSFT